TAAMGGAEPRGTAGGGSAGTGSPGGRGRRGEEVRGAKRDSGRAALAPHGEWDCDFPAGHKRDTRVRMIVTVRPDGTAESVRIVPDPGEGLGAAARACAMRQRFVAATDEDGHPVRGETPEFSVRYIH